MLTIQCIMISLGPVAIVVRATSLVRQASLAGHVDADGDVEISEAQGASPARFVRQASLAGQVDADGNVEISEAQGASGRSAASYKPVPVFTMPFPNGAGEKTISSFLQSTDAMHHQDTQFCFVAPFTSSPANIGREGEIIEHAEDVITIYPPTHEVMTFFSMDPVDPGQHCCLGQAPNETTELTMHTSTCWQTHSMSPLLHQASNSYSPSLVEEETLAVVVAQINDQEKHIAEEQLIQVIKASTHKIFVVDKVTYHNIKDSVDISKLVEGARRRFMRRRRFRFS